MRDLASESVRVQKRLDLSNGTFFWECGKGWREREGSRLGRRSGEQRGEILTLEESHRYICEQGEGEGD